MSIGLQHLSFDGTEWIDSALDRIPYGLSVWSNDFTLVHVNDHFLSIYNLKVENVRPGSSLEAIVDQIVMSGIYANRSASEIYRFYRDYLDNGLSLSAISGSEQLSNHRTLEIKGTKLSDGVWTIAHVDITDARTRQRANDEHAVWLDAAVSNMAEGLCMFDSERRLVVSNAQYATMYDLPAELLVPGTPHADIVAYRLKHGMEPMTSGDDFLERHEALLSQSEPSTEIVRLRSGRFIMIRHQTLSTGGWIATHLDITDQQSREKALAEQNIFFDEAINNMHQGLCMFDADRKLIVSNRLYATMYRLPPNDIVPGMSLDEILDLRLKHGNEPIAGRENYVKRRAELVENRLDDSDIVELRDGRVIAVFHRPMKNGGWVSTHQDITEQRRNEERIQHLARHDALTDLANRTLFQERIAGLGARIDRGERVAVLAIDLDHFKYVNDTLGHAAGDELLKQVASRLVSCCRETDTVARLGGDEFAILQVSIEQPEAASVLARRIVSTIAEPFHIGTQQCSVGASIGVAVAPFDGQEADTLLQCADLALYRAKGDGRGTFHFYEAAMDAALQRRRAIEASLLRALSHNEFMLAFQPMINVAERRVGGFEALLRWNHPEHGLMMPDDFIPVAEEASLIVPIGEWVLREACSAAASWPDPIGVAVNLSPIQFKSRNLVNQVKGALTAAKLHPSRLELEITESVLLVNSDLTLTILHQLRDMGVKLSMDDFGTGYSSLSYLRSFPFDKIKIDRSFVRDSSNNGDAKAIVKAVIGLGQSLGMATTAEGVETAAQLGLIREQGCTEAQGFFFSKPLSVTAISDWLKWFQAGDFFTHSDRGHP